MTERNTKVVVLSNEKGGCGKSTLAMHLATGYLYKGNKVATIDLDGRQGTLTRYIENRVKYSKEQNLSFPTPEHLVVIPHYLNNEETTKEDKEELMNEIESLKSDYDVIIVDTPGSYNHLIKAALFKSDIVITPINDSLLDLDNIFHADDNMDLTAGNYIKTLKQIEQNRVDKNHGEINWVILRNRISHLSTKNNLKINEVLKKGKEEFGFEYIPGIGERVLYKEMFSKGITILDLMYNLSEDERNDLSISSIASKNEIETIINVIDAKLK